MTNPQELLEEGRKLLAPILEPHGFVYKAGELGKGSGGHFAKGAFVRSDRKVEFWFRFSLSAGYEFRGMSCAHEDLIWAITGEEGRNKYPGYGEDPLDGFRDLADDLKNFGEAFITGSDSELKELFVRTAMRPRPKGLKGI